MNVIYTLAALGIVAALIALPLAAGAIAAGVFSGKRARR